MAYEPAIGMERLCTIKEIAQAADVGVATVFRVVKGQPGATNDTTARVIATIEQINRQKIARAVRPDVHSKPLAGR